MARSGKGRRAGEQRVGSGSLRGRRLLALPAGLDGVRPTGSRVRSAVFDRLQFELSGARVLDAFAGTGALAIEAVSRGAAEAVCVEVDGRVTDFMRRQVAVLDLGERIEVVQADIRAHLASATPRAFDLVLIDPPYADRAAYEDTLRALAEGAPSMSWLRDGAVVVCEWMPAALPGLAWPAGFRLEARREHGQTALDFLRYEATEPS